MTDSELKQLVENNAIRIQAILDAQVEDKERIEERSLSTLRLENFVERITNIEEQVRNLLSRSPENSD